MFKIQEENTIECVAECAALGKLHYDEVESKADTVPYNINMKTAKLLLDNNLLSMVAARSDGELVGYIINLIGENFLTSEVEAKEVGIFIRKDHRGGKNFYKMLKFSQQCLLERGARSQYIMFKAGHDVGLAERMGYEKTETIYQKIF